MGKAFARPKMIFDKLKKFDIVFDSPEMDCPPVYSSGDVVSGKVVLEFSAESKIDSLKLHAEGFAKVHWTESRSAGSSTAYTQNYSDEVEYLNRREVLLQAGQSFTDRDGVCFGHRRYVCSDKVSFSLASICVFIPVEACFSLLVKLTEFTI